MARSTEEKLARSLTGEDTAIIPFLPYLLQDLWALGGDASCVVELMKKHIQTSDRLQVLDLACGKGNIAIHIAKEVGCSVTGVDIIPAFIDYAIKKAEQWNVFSQCKFIVDDVNNAVKAQKGYDCVIFSASGDVLGEPEEMLGSLKQTVRPGGYLILDESYKKEGSCPQLQYRNYEYLCAQQWDDLFLQEDLQVLEKVFFDGGELEEANEEDMLAIERRVQELSKKYPNKAKLFEDYLRSQKAECADIEQHLENVVWMLKKAEDE